MPDLVTPSTDLHAAWLDCHHEWGPGRHEDGFGVRETDDVVSEAGFAAYVTRLVDQADPAQAEAMGRMPCSYRWIVEDGQVLGGIALRHELSAKTEPLGHVGYGVRPSARGRGVATWALGAILAEARTLGLDRVVAVCDVDNAASARVIEHHGGRLEGIRDTEHGTVRRHVIGL
ncbi:GNAT family N-acetyltransferase [Nocardioides sp. HDW12B]|uniref:GNAT family N-acetyltransferase n=1 Tax=Nocardioides sp. HDW12B TaxID=2714939 RepID=UPI00140AC8D8|nr:GNAT family N-acetyltransferase [Nocardioides sp. HDW12B]QIK65046.1 GNAT family N-acetyltransferase [Nocardioides sp. HDW12B]